MRSAFSGWPARRCELVRAPRAQPEGQHVSWYRLLRPSGTEALEVPIDDGDVGDVYVHVAYMRDGRLHQAERVISALTPKH